MLDPLEKAEVWSKVLLLSDSFLLVLHFLGGVCGELRLLREWRFLYAQWHKEKILILDNLKKMNIIVVDWCCMCKKSGNLLITFFFIVKQQENYEVCLFICLLLIRLCLEGWDLLVSWRWQMGSRLIVTIWFSFFLVNFMFDLLMLWFVIKTNSNQQWLHITASIQAEASVSHEVH
jgi:hypothetical protein